MSFDRPSEPRGPREHGPLQSAMREGGHGLTAVWIRQVTPRSLSKKKSEYSKLEAEVSSCSGAGGAGGRSTSKLAQTTHPAIVFLEKIHIRTSYCE